MGPRPPGGTIERINPFGNYCPENCKWSTSTIEQHNNTRMRHWAREAGFLKYENRLSDHNKRIMPEMLRADRVDESQVRLHHADRRR
jgi:hypothetical protein